MAKDEDDEEGNFLEELENTFEVSETPPTEVPKTATRPARAARPKPPKRVIPAPALAETAVAENETVMAEQERAGISISNDTPWFERFDHYQEQLSQKGEWQNAIVEIIRVSPAPPEPVDKFEGREVRSHMDMLKRVQTHWDGNESVFKYALKSRTAKHFLHRGTIPLPYSELRRAEWDTQLQEKIRQERQRQEQMMSFPNQPPSPGYPGYPAPGYPAHAGGYPAAPAGYPPPPGGYVPPPGYPQPPPGGYPSPSQAQPYPYPAPQPPPEQHAAPQPAPAPPQPPPGFYQPIGWPAGCFLPVPQPAPTPPPQPAPAPAPPMMMQQDPIAAQLRDEVHQMRDLVTQARADAAAANARADALAARLATPQSPAPPQQPTHSEGLPRLDGWIPMRDAKGAITYVPADQARELLGLRSSAPAQQPSAPAQQQAPEPRQANPAPALQPQQPSSGAPPVYTLGAAPQQPTYAAPPVNPHAPAPYQQPYPPQYGAPPGYPPQYGPPPGYPPQYGPPPGYPPQAPPQPAMAAPKPAVAAAAGDPFFQSVDHALSTVDKLRKLAANPLVGMVPNSPKEVSEAAPVAASPEPTKPDPIFDAGWWRFARKEDGTIDPSLGNSIGYNMGDNVPKLVERFTGSIVEGIQKVLTMTQETKRVEIDAEERREQRRLQALRQQQAGQHAPPPLPPQYAAPPPPPQQHVSPPAPPQQAYAPPPPPPPEPSYEGEPAATELATEEPVFSDTLARRAVSNGMLPPPPRS